MNILVSVLVVVVIMLAFVNILQWLASSAQSTSEHVIAQIVAKDYLPQVDEDDDWAFLVSYKIKGETKSKRIYVTKQVFNHFIEGEKITIQP